MNYKAIIGLGFGDEGKGLFTDYLCSKNKNSLVVRYCGGQQAGHTVVRDNFRHVFSNFGSGTYRGNPSYFSKHCTVYPITLLNELDILKNKGIYPKLFIDRNTPLTTPLDILHNQEHSQYGTCGFGVGSTIQREEDYFSLKFGDIFNHYILTKKIDVIREYYYTYKNVDLEEFILSCIDIKNSENIEISDGIPSNFDSVIFEGAQGLMLDMNIGIFPYVSRGNTGTNNILELSSSKDITLFLISRAYQTRHGSGPLSNEGIPHNIQKNLMETNKTNQFQGEFRYGILDVSLLEYAINSDDYIRESKDKNLVITCLDHIPSEYRFTYDGKIIYSTNEYQFIKKIGELLKISQLYLSRSENSDFIEKIDLRSI